MATRDEVFASKYLKAADLKGRPRVVKIEECWQEKLKTNDGKEREKTIVKFAGEEKTLVMNMVNWDAIADITGEGDTLNWPDHRIELYPTKTQMGGKTVDCIRIRKPDSKEAAPKARASQKDALEGDGDEIPF
jgi:hypothetical protein